jgi:hypothetical protein
LGARPSQIRASGCRNLHRVVPSQDRVESRWGRHFRFKHLQRSHPSTPSLR